MTKTACLFACAAALALSAGAAAAQSRDQQPSSMPPVSAMGQGQRPAAGPAPAPRALTPEQAQRRQEAMSGQPDVLLDVPNLSVQQIELEVNNLEVDISLQARLASLLNLTAGAQARIERVRINITGVQATALLVVRLENVRAIIDRTLTTIDNNPQLVERLLQTTDNAVNTVGGVANNAVGTVGGVANNAVGVAGSALTRGSVLNPAAAGLTPEGDASRNRDGQTVRRFRDQAGRVVEVVTDTAGRVVSSRAVG